MFTYPLVSGLFFLSGITGLVYQVLWARYLHLFLGNTGHAHALVLGVFLGGLALGNWWLGRVADRFRDQLRFYGFLEIGIGVLAVLSPVLLEVLSGFYMTLARGAGGGSLTAIRFALCALVLLPPTICMGGTLPALTRYFTDALADLEARLGWLYFLNSAGAALGALLAAFVFVPLFGLDLSVSLVALVNVLIGVISIMLSKRAQPGSTSAPSDVETVQLGAHRSESGAYRRSGGRVITWIFIAVFVSGFVSLAYEIAWIRLLALILGSSAYSFALMLSAFIAGIAAGAFWIGWKRPQQQNALFYFALAELGIAFAVLLTVPIYERLPFIFLNIRSMLSAAPEAYLLYLLLKFLVCFALMFLPAFFMGVTLPLAAQAVTFSVDEIGEKVGALYSSNTFGNVVGALLVGLVLFPLFGFQKIILSGAIINCVIGMLFLYYVGKERGISSSMLGGIAALLFGLVALSAGGADQRLLVSAPFLAVNPGTLPSFKSYKRGFRGQKVLYYKDDTSTTVSVTRYPSGGLTLKVNGKADASTGRDISTQVLLGHIPMFLHPAPQTAMIVGLGSGVTAGSALRHETVEKLDVIEIVPAMREAAELFSEYNHNVLQDKRLNLVIDDAKSFLHTTPRRYDVVISEPSNPWIAGVGNVFTVEFYNVVKSRLNQHGIMVQWLHTYSMDDQIVQLILRTFSHVFDHITIWNTVSGSGGGGDFLLVGSVEPVSPDFSRMEGLLKNSKISGDLKRVGVDSLLHLLGTQSASSQVVSALKGRGVLNYDRFPILEYQAPRLLFQGASSRLFLDNDERLIAPGVSKLFLSEYLRSRGRGISIEDLRGLAFYSAKWGESEMYKRILTTWSSLYPEDSLPLILLTQLDRSKGRLDEALFRIEVASARQELSNARLMLTGALVALDQEFGQRYFMGSPIPVEKAIRFVSAVVRSGSGAASAEVSTALEALRARDVIQARELITLALQKVSGPEVKQVEDPTKTPDS